MVSSHWTRKKCKEEAEEINSYVPAIPCLCGLGWGGGDGGEGVKLGLGEGEERCCSNVCLFFIIIFISYYPNLFSMAIN